jgi:hypothetical protein
MAWSGKSSSLTSVGDVITVSSLTASKFNMILAHVMNNTLGSYFSNHAMRFNSDNTAKYALSRGIGGSNYTSIGDNELEMVGGNMRNGHFVVSFVCNISGKDKLGLACSVEDDNSTDPNAGVAPSRQETALKWENTSQFTSVSVENNGGYQGTTDWKVGSNLTVLTGDETETATLQDGTIFEETDTNKAYIWSSSSETWTQL